MAAQHLPRDLVQAFTQAVNTLADAMKKSALDKLGVDWSKLISPAGWSPVRIKTRRNNHCRRTSFMNESKSTNLLHSLHISSKVLYSKVLNG